MCAEGYAEAVAGREASLLRFRNKNEIHVSCLDGLPTVTSQMRFGPSSSYSGMQEGTFSPPLVTFLFRSRSEAWFARRVRARLVIGKPGAPHV
jgi:hypothetical protein